MKPEFIDTHCHIHDSEFLEKYQKTADSILADARAVGITSVICVGTDVRSSREAVAFAASHDSVYASIALHPHEAAVLQAKDLELVMTELESLYETNGPVVAIGECGLDYYYHPDEFVRQKQRQLFIRHLELAQKLHLPLIFHVRDAFDDFFSIIDSFPKLRGVVHSFTADSTVLQGVVKRGLYVGLNGIMTFTKDERQLEAAKAVPLDKLVIETDAPFLTPKPFRGTMCEPKHVINITEFLGELRGEPVETLAQATTKNAKKLFNL